MRAANPTSIVAICRASLVGGVLAIAGSLFGPPVHAQDAGPVSSSESTYQAIIKQLAQDHDSPAAETKLLALAKADPSYTKTYYNLALIDASGHRWSEAIAWLKQYRSGADAPHKARADKLMVTFQARQKKDYVSALSQVQSLIKAGQRDDAYRTAQTLPRIDDSLSIGYEICGQLAEYRGDRSTAVQYLQLALARAPESEKPGIGDELVRNLVAEAKSDTGAGRYSDAASLYEKAWQASPQHPDLGLMAALSYAKDGHDADCRRIATYLAANADGDVQSTAREILNGTGSGQ